MRQKITTSRSLVAPRPAFRSITYKIKFNPEDSFVKTPTYTRMTTIQSLKKEARTPVAYSSEKYGNREAKYSGAGVKYIDIFHNHMELGNLSRREKSDMFFRRKASVKLPQVKENPDSDFTVLEPVNGAIEFIEGAIQQIRLELPKTLQEIQEIRGEIGSIAPPILKQLQQIEEATYQKLRYLRNLMRKDCTRHQNHRVEAVRGMHQTKTYIDNLKVGTTKSLEDTVLLQKQIFENELPYELKVEQDGEMVESLI